MYGHIAKLDEAEKKGVEEAGGSADVYQSVSTKFLRQSFYTRSSQLP